MLAGSGAQWLRWQRGATRHGTRAAGDVPGDRLAEFLHEREREEAAKDASTYGTRSQTIVTVTTRWVGRMGVHWHLHRAATQPTPCTSLFPQRPGHGDGAVAAGRRDVGSEHHDAAARLGHRQPASHELGLCVLRHLSSTGGPSSRRHPRVRGVNPHSTRRLS